jgi:hypothetical protein
MRIIRTELKMEEYQLLSLPAPAKLLHVAPGRGSGYYIDLWSLDGEDGGDQKVGIAIAGTGQPLSVQAIFSDHIGTCVMPDGYVWHVFAMVFPKGHE